MNEKNIRLKNKVRELSSDSRFRHHKWYFEYHLEIVEKLVGELCQIYKEADKEMLGTMVWCHDLDKICKDLGLTMAGVMEEVGFSEEEIGRIEKMVETMDRHKELDLSQESIEIKIISSADGAAHVIGPFFSIFWYENPEREIKDLMAGDLEKLKRDWERKLVLPEVKKAFEDRFRILLEQRGEYPEFFIK